MWRHGDMGQAAVTDRSLRDDSSRAVSLSLWGRFHPHITTAGNAAKSFQSSSLLFFSLERTDDLFEQTCGLQTPELNV